MISNIVLFELPTSGHVFLPHNVDVDVSSQKKLLFVNHEHIVRRTRAAILVGHKSSDKGTAAA
jgi:hypothetical protein